MTPTPTRRAALPSLSELSVQLIDDDPFTLELVGVMLRKMGVTRISMASDGERGTASIGKGWGAPDVVICDLNMPVRDGFQVMESLAACGFSGAVILLSGMDARTLHSAALMGRFHHLNVLGVMHKPVSKPDLAALLAKVHA